LPTVFESTEARATATAFAVGCDYWSVIYVDDDYYYTPLSFVAEKVNDRSILFYFCFPTYVMPIPMYSGSVISKGVRVFSAYVSARTCNTHHAFVHP
jgi:hypothetical protein